jgi:hypothetical protein
VIRYFIRWRERYRVKFDLYFTKESFNHNQSANKIVASDDLYASGQERKEQQELQVYDDDHFASDFKPKFSSNIHRNRAKFYFPFPYSHRMQHVRSEQYDAYCFPPLTTVTIVTAEAIAVAPTKTTVQYDTRQEDDRMKALESDLQPDLTNDEWFCIVRRLS